LDHPINAGGEHETRERSAMSARIEPAAIVNVAVAIMQRADGRVLMAQRPPGKPAAGFWEFPGGKFAANETSLQALVREIHEELGVDIDSAFPWLTREYVYPEQTVRLHFYRVRAWRGEPHGREGQRLCWEDPAAMSVTPVLPANEKVIAALRLPPCYAISNAAALGVDLFMVRLTEALDRGVRLIQLREPALVHEQLSVLADRVVAVAHTYGAQVFINGDAALAQQCGADGVHLRSAQLMALECAPALPLWSASCHTAAELARAAHLQADFVVLSPVQPTASHPGEPGIGWQRFAELARDYPVPVYALGGLQRNDLDTALRHGAHGIALLSGAW